MATKKKRALPKALKSGPKDLSKLPPALRKYWENKRKNQKKSK